MKPTCQLATVLLFTSLIVGCSHTHRTPELAQRPYTPEEASWAAAQYRWLPEWEQPQRAPIARELPAHLAEVQVPARQVSSTAARSEAVPAAVAQSTAVVPAMAIAPTAAKPAQAAYSPSLSLPKPIVDDQRRITPSSPPAYRTGYEIIDDGGTWQPVQTMQRHRVRKGESLAQIARKYYGDPKQWTRIQKANALANPNAIKPGLVLVIP